jgi:hypothetical protein
MSILEQAPGLLTALRGEMTPKFLATRSASGTPNVVPCVSILPADDQLDTLFFGNFLLRKSIKNLQEERRLAVMVITPQLKGWILKGDFVEFQRTGLYVDQQMSGNLLRYNAYTGIRNAGVIRVKSVEGSFSISKGQVLLDYLRARLAGLGSASKALASGPDSKAVAMPIPVQREFGRMVAVKVLAWIGQDGYPFLIPALSLQPAGKTGLVGWLGARGLPYPPPGVQVASNILTFEAISYQAKGVWQTNGKSGLLRVQEIYAGGPPYPGGRVA